MIYKGFKSSYNAGLDFWKWIFSLLIVFSHGIFLADQNNGDKLIFGHALIGVEFYSILSGYFLVQSIYRKYTPPQKKTKKNNCPNALMQSHTSIQPTTSPQLPKLDSTNTTQNVPDYQQFDCVNVWPHIYIWHKIKNMLPYYIPAFIFCFFMWLYKYIDINHPGKWQLLCNCLKAIWELLFFHSSGVATAGINGTWWYISSMLFIEWLLYPIIACKEKLFVYYIAPLSIFLTLGFMSGTCGQIANGGFAGFIRIDNLRLLLGICTGCILFYFVQYFQKISLRIWVRLILTFIELSGYLLIFVIAYKNVNGISNYVDLQMDFLTLPILFVSIGITASKQDLIWELYNPQVCKFLGKLSLCLYLVHWRCLDVVSDFMPDSIQNSYHLKLIAFFIISILVALFIIKISEFIKAMII